MNKESIYQIIGYHGEYSDNVKKALKKLLKENHPDYHGDKEIFKLITEVKKELETNQVSFMYSNIDIKKYDDINIDYCRRMINKLEKRKIELVKEMSVKKETNVNLINAYKDLYRESINEASNLLKNDNNKLQEIKIFSLLMVIFLVTIFVLSIVTKSIIMFMVFGIMCFLFILIIGKYFVFFNEIGQKSEMQIKRYVHTISDIQKNVERKNNLSQEIMELERKVKKVENDLRFYNNLLK